MFCKQKQIAWNFDVPKFVVCDITRASFVADRILYKAHTIAFVFKQNLDFIHFSQEFYFYKCTKIKLNYCNSNKLKIN